ncbi:MAG: cysteine methyltransferase [Pseudonocardiales bacterium]|nr:MAG: cysteine methyltransferase [Pseudonocardiales bacterium]
MRFSYVDSPLGELLVTRDESGIAGLYLPTGRCPVTARPEWTRDDAAFDDVRAQLDEYFAGTRREFDLPLHPTGTGFQKRVWDALLEIPYGQTASYTDVATRAGSPRTVRAAGTALATNPLPIVVPCHRVLRTGGGLGGYTGGLERKQFLLELEGGSPT